MLVKHSRKRWYIADKSKKIEKNIKTNIEIKVTLEITQRRLETAKISQETWILAEVKPKEIKMNNKLKWL